MSATKQKKMMLFRQMTTLRGELLLIKRSQVRLQEKLDAVLGSYAGIASMLNEERKLLDEMVLASSNVVQQSRCREEVKKAA